MALYDHAFTAEIQDRISVHYQALGLALGYSSPEGQLASPQADTPFSEGVGLLIKIANGEISRRETSKADVERVKVALGQLQTLLLGNALQTKTVIPDDFWHSKLGVLFSRVIWWIHADDLISISNAAALAFGENSQPNRMRIVRAIDRGLLDWVPDPSIANPQQNRCVYKFQVIRLAEERQRPG